MRDAVPDWLAIGAHPDVYSTSPTWYAKTGSTLSLVGSGLETILLSGLYLYATQGDAPAEMNRKMLKRAFTARERD